MATVDKDDDGMVDGELSASAVVVVGAAGAAGAAGVVVVVLAVVTIDGIGTGVFNAVGATIGGDVVAAVAVSFSHLLNDTTFDEIDDAFVPLDDSVLIAL